MKTRPAPPAPAPPSRRALVIANVLLLAAGAAVYANSFAGPFIFDDEAAIAQNPNLRQLWPLTRAAWSPGGPLEGRPVVALSFAVNYALGGLHVGGYHAVNLALHLASGLLVLFCLRRLLARVPATAPLAFPVAFGVALLWLVHPLNSEAVVYLTQRTELFVGLFYLLTLAAVIRAAEEGAPRWWSALAVVACALGMASKEVMVTAPLVMVLVDRAFFSSSFAEVWRRRRALHLGLGATWAVLATLMVAAPHHKSVGADLGVSPLQYLANQCVAIPTYLRLVLLPTALTVDYGEAKPMDLALALPGAALLVTLAALTVWAWRRSPPLGFAGAWFFLILGPTSSVVPIITEVAAERRMYLPSIAVLALLVVGGVLLARRAGEAATGTGVVAACSLLAVVAGVGTHLRVRDYSSALAIWTDAVRKRPTNDRAHNNLAQLLFDRGQVEEARAALETAVQLSPRYAAAQDNLCGVLVTLKRFAEARPHCEQAVQLKPSLASAHEHLGLVLDALGAPAEAEREFRLAIAAAPERPTAHISYGTWLSRHDRLEQAMDELAEAIRLAPDSPSAHNALGAAFMVMDRPDDAKVALERSLALGPSDEAHLNLAKIAAGEQRWPEALDHAHQALALSPGNMDAQNTVVFVLVRQGRRDDAVSYLHELLRSQPGNPVAHMNLGILHAQQGRFAEALPELEAAARLDPSLELADMVEEARRQARQAATPP